MGCARPGALRACPFAGRGTSADSFILSRRDRVHPAEELPSRFVVLQQFRQPVALLDRVLDRAQFLGHLVHVLLQLAHVHGAEDLDL